MTNNSNFNFDWRIIRDAIALLFIIYVLIVLFSSCGSSKTIETTSNDSVFSRHIEMVNEWYDISKVDTFTRDRFVTIVLSEKGDTIKEKELIYVCEKAESKVSNNVNVEKIDSANNKSSYVHKQIIEKELSMWQKFQLNTYTYLLFLVGLCFIIFIINYKVRTKVFE